MGKAVELCPLEGGGRSWQWRRLLGCCRNLVPRGRRLCSVRNRYADWVQAQPAAGEGAALFPVGGRRGASLSPAADRGKGASLFSADGGFNLVSRGRKWGFVRNRYVIWVQAQPARKTSHREVFLGCANRKLAWGHFSYKSPLFCNPNFGLQNSPAKAPDDTGVSSSAELDQQALPAGHPPPFEKGGRKLLFCKLGAAR